MPERAPNFAEAPASVDTLVFERPTSFRQEWPLIHCVWGRRGRRAGLLSGELCVCAGTTPVWRGATTANARCCEWKSMQDQKSSNKLLSSLWPGIKLSFDGQRQGICCLGNAG